MRALIIVATLALSALAGAAVAQRDVWLPVASNGAPSPWGAGVTPLQAQPDSATLATLGLGWVYAWDVVERPPQGVEFVQLVNVEPAGPMQGWDVVVRTARANPGSLWILGNEVDVPDQNGMWPEQYAAVYHELYTVLKLADPTCRIAIGSVAMWTPSRQRYMERVLTEYQRLHGTALPVDVWNVHAYTIPEASIGAPVGVLGYSLEQTQQLDVEEFVRRLIALRLWLEQQGYGATPLMVSEYGVLWPASDAEIVEYMQATGAWLESSGLVQRWAWFSANDTRYPGVLWDGGLTTVGRAFAALAGRNLDVLGLGQ